MGKTMPEWRKIEFILDFFGLFTILVFPVLIGIPVAGYIIETAALFFVVYFSYRRKQLLLTIGSIGSIVSASILFGPSMLLMGLWGMIIIPGTIFGRLMSGGLHPSRAFAISMIILSIGSLIVFWSERELIYKSLDSAQSWILADIQNGNQGPAGSNLQSADFVSEIIYMIKRLMPALWALSAVAQLLLAGMVFFIVLKSTGEFFNGFGSFIYWKMPFSIIYLTGISIAMRLAGAETVKIIADNMLLFLGIFYAVFGFSVFEYYLRKIRLTLFWRILFYVVLVFLQLPGLVMAALIGLFDSYFDFRQVKAKMLG
jgi:hypothetical protein